MSSIPSSSTSVQIYALPTGKLHLPDRWLFEDGDHDMRRARQFSPDFSFLISHPSGKNVLFDLGMRKDLGNNPTVIQSDYPLISPQVPSDAFDLLSVDGPVKPDMIDDIIFSHLHFDHTGDCTLFPHATLLVGPGTHAATHPGYPTDAKSPFLSSILSHPGFRELSFQTDVWTTFGPFPRAHDYFGDGSFYLLDAPGHMPGHLGALAHAGGLGEWVFMGGDCCHHRALLVGARPVSVSVGPNGTRSFHKDPETAIATMRKVRELERQMDGELLVALAHDAVLEGRMPVYPAKLNEWRGSKWKKEVDEVVREMYGER